MMVGIRLCRKRGVFDLECAVRLRSYSSLEDGLFLAEEGLVKEAWLEEGHPVAKQSCQRYLCDSLIFFVEVCSFLIMVQNIGSFFAS